MRKTESAKVSYVNVSRLMQARQRERTSLVSLTPGVLVRRAWLDRRVGFLKTDTLVAKATAKGRVPGRLSFVAASFVSNISPAPLGQPRLRTNPARTMHGISHNNKKSQCAVSQCREGRVTLAAIILSR